MALSKYETLAARKDHSDTLYYNILGFCIILNSAFGAGAGTLLHDLQGYRDCIGLAGIAIAGLFVTANFNDYLRNEKLYQANLRNYFDRHADEFADLPDIFERNKEAREDARRSKWSRIPRLIARFWFMVLCADIGIAVRIYHG